MKNVKFFFLGLLAMLSMTHCSLDESIEQPTPLGEYQNGILIVNEGSFSTPSASVDFLKNNTISKNIYTAATGETILGNVLNDVGLTNNLAYLVLNVPNKVEVVNRYTFKKVKTITDEVENARYLAFANGNAYLTCQDFFNFRRLNIYNSSDQIIKKIPFDRYAEKVVEASGKIYVQTDGVTYAAPNWTPAPTGSSITVINPNNNTIENTLNVDSGEIIQDLASFQGNAYVLTTNTSGSYLYRCQSNGTVMTKTALPQITNASEMTEDNGFLYIRNGISIYKSSLNAPAQAQAFINFGTGNTVYGMKAIDGKIYVSRTDFSPAGSKVFMYDITSGTLQNTYDTGIGTSKFFKN